MFRFVNQVKAVRAVMTGMMREEERVARLERLRKSLMGRMK